MNKTIEKQDVDKKLPKKYIFLGSLLWIISLFLLYSYIKNYEKIKYLEGFLLTLFPIIIYSLLTYFIKESISRITLIKLNVWCLYALFIYYIYLFIYLYDKATMCPPPFINLELYKECHKPISIIAHLTGNYGGLCFVLLLIYTSVLFFLKPLNKQTNTTINSFMLFLIFLLVIILPLQMGYLLFSN